MRRGVPIEDFRKRLRGWEIQVQTSCDRLFGVHAWARFILGDRRRNQDCLRLVSDASGTKMWPGWRNFNVPEGGQSEAGGGEARGPRADVFGVRAAAAGDDTESTK